MNKIFYLLTFCCIFATSKGQNVNTKEIERNKMSSTIPFTKMQGVGNDYIYVNTLLYSVPDPETTAIKWSDRHFGIGSDGLVLIGAPQDAAKADFRMRIFNADGSEAKMCGNASRCIGKYVYEKGLFHGDTVRLETASGIKILRLHIEDGKVDSVTVDMGEPQLDVPAQFTGHEPQMTSTLLDNIETLGNGAKAEQFVSMGNPHYVSFVKSIADVALTEEGQRLERDAAFPERCNIEFAEKKESADSRVTTFRTRVWERGSGITMACGTGACATAVAAAALGIAARKSDIVMDGGTLHIEWNPADNHVYMTGPAAFSFEGEAEL